MSNVTVTYTAHGTDCGGCQRAITQACAKLARDESTRVTGHSATIGTHVAIVARPATVKQLYSVKAARVQRQRCVSPGLLTPLRARTA